VHGAAIYPVFATSTECIQHGGSTESMVNTLHGKQEMRTLLSNRSIACFDVVTVDIIYAEHKAPPAHTHDCCAN